MHIEGALAEQFIIASRQVTEMTATLAQEMADFAGRRMRAQLDFMSALSNWSNPQDMMEAQFRFVAEASKDYVDEIDHMSEVLRRMNDEALSARSRAAKHLALDSLCTAVPGSARGALISNHARSLIFSRSEASCRRSVYPRRQRLVVEKLEREGYACEIRAAHRILRSFEAKLEAAKRRARGKR